MTYRQRENEAEIDFVLIKHEHWWILRNVNAIQKSCNMLLKNTLILKFYLLRKIHSAEKTPVTRLFPSGAHLHN